MTWTTQIEKRDDKCGQTIPGDETKMKVVENINYHFCMSRVNV